MAAEHLNMEIGVYGYRNQTSFHIYVDGCLIFYSLSFGTLLSSFKLNPL